MNIKTVINTFILHHPKIENYFYHQIILTYNNLMIIFNIILWYINKKLPFSKRVK